MEKESRYELRYIERYIEIYNGIARFPCDSTAFLLRVAKQRVRVKTHGATNHESDSVASQAVSKQLGKFAVAVRYVTLALLWVTERRYTVTYIHISQIYYRYVAETLSGCFDPR